MEQEHSGGGAETRVPLKDWISFLPRLEWNQECVCHSSILVFCSPGRCCDRAYAAMSTFCRRLFLCRLQSLDRGRQEEKIV